MLRSYAFSLALAVLTSCYIGAGVTIADASAHDRLDHDDPAVLLASVAHAWPDAFKSRDNDPDDVLSVVCGDDDPGVDAFFVQSLDRLCAGYLVLQPERRIVLVVTRGNKLPVAVGYDLGDVNGYVAPIPGWRGFPAEYR